MKKKDLKPNEDAETNEDTKKNTVHRWVEPTDEEYEALKVRIRLEYPDHNEEEVEADARFAVRMWGGY